jgi:hypothetical protein
VTHIDLGMVPIFSFVTCSCNMIFKIHFRWFFSWARYVGSVKRKDLTVQTESKYSTWVDPGENCQYFYIFLVHLQKTRTLGYLIIE